MPVIQVILLRVHFAQAHRPSLTKSTAKVYNCGRTFYTEHAACGTRLILESPVFIEMKNVLDTFTERQLFVLANNYRHYGYSGGGRVSQRQVRGTRGVTPVSYKVLEKITPGLSLRHTRWLRRGEFRGKYTSVLYAYRVYCVEINEGRISSLAVQPPFVPTFPPRPGALEHPPV